MWHMVEYYKLNIDLTKTEVESVEAAYAISFIYS